VSDVTPQDGPLARGAGRDCVLFFDASSGVAGDMLVAALLDLGVPTETVDEAIAGLGLPEVHIEHAHVVRSGIRARRFIVRPSHPDSERTHAHIREILDSSKLTAGAKALAVAAFDRLARAEAAVHGVPVSDVHFHEVGAVDSIVDVVGTAACLDHLGARVVASPLPLGRGTVSSRHGVLPLPAPATVHCLLGVPTYDGGVDAELVTPTGACLVATAASEFLRWPAMRPLRTGWGAGSRELPNRPNVLRVILGRPTAAERSPGSDRPLVVLESNLDDSTAEITAHALERALEAGALDAWTTAIGMKKGRPGVMVSVLAHPTDAEALARDLMAETSTLGVRLRACDRLERPRRIIEVETRFGPVPVKIADGDGLPPNVAPEFDACRSLAATHRVPVKEVVAAALLEAQRLPKSG